jgi:hypothetical protein
MLRRVVFTRRFAVLSSVVALACSSSEPATKVPLAQARADSAQKAAGVRAEPELSPAAKAALDSGNALFRKKAYAPALAQYRLASALAPKHLAPYYGINMVAQATGNKALSDSALRNMRESGAAPLMMPHPSLDSAEKKGRPEAKKGSIS